jgi:pSer/pThr/pTyr-binding forkhead associated (FHA) protein
VDKRSAIANAAALPTANQTPCELQRQLELERQGRAFVVFRNGENELIVVPLPEAREITLGRRAESEISLAWDPAVSRLHAELQRVGDEWLLVDDGLSRNGTFVNDERVIGRRRLLDGDLVRCGRTAILFSHPAAAARETAMGPDEPSKHVTASQRRVLIELCRPLSQERTFAAPAANRAIAARLCITVDAVKTHLHTLFEIFEVAELPQNQKRTALAEHAVRSGVVTARDLASA